MGLGGCTRGHAWTHFFHTKPASSLGIAQAMRTHTKHGAARAWCAHIDLCRNDGGPTCLANTHRRSHVDGGCNLAALCCRDRCVHRDPTHPFLRTRQIRLHGAGGQGLASLALDIFPPPFSTVMMQHSTHSIQIVHLDGLMRCLAENECCCRAGLLA